MFSIIRKKRKILMLCGIIAAFLLYLLPLRAEKSMPAQEGIFAGDLTVPSQILEQAQKLSLEEATRIAAARSLNIQISRLQQKARKQDIPSAQAIYDTDFKMDATYSHDRSEQPSIVLGSRELKGDAIVSLEKKIPTGTNIKVEGGTERNSTDTSFSTLSRNYQSFAEVSVEQPLLRNFFGYVDRKEIQKIKLDVKKFRYEKLDEIEDKILDARLKYWELNLAYQNLKTRQRALRKAQDFYSINREKLEIGLVENPDIYASEANVRKRVVDVWESVTNLYQASYALKVLLNSPEVELIQPLEDFTLNELDPEYEKNLELAYQSRWDIKKALLDLEAKGVDVKIAKNSLLPELNFEGRMASTSLDRDMAPSQGEVFGFNHMRYFAAFHFKSSLEMREEKSKLLKSNFNLKAAEKEWQLLRLNVGKEFDDAYRQLKLVRYKVKQTRDIENLERRKLEEEEKNFNRGRSDSATVIDFQEDLIDAELNSISSVVEYFKAVDQFYRSQNRLLYHTGLSKDFNIEAEGKTTENGFDV